jgi:hypothetical protein
MLIFVSTVQCLLLRPSPTTKAIRVMIQYQLLIQFFITLLMWQGRPSSYFIFKIQKVVGDHLAT